MTDTFENVHLSFIGCGVMAESMIAGLLRQELVTPDRIVGSHPREARRRELETTHGIRMFESNADAAQAVRDGETSAVVLSVKPQRVSHVLSDLKGSVDHDGLVISIVAGAKIETISRELGTQHVVRAMPNTPSQIGAGITAWTCDEKVSEQERSHVRRLLSALGKELFV